MKHAARVHDFKEGAQMCNTSQSCLELEPHACACESAIKCATLARLRKNVRATRCSFFTFWSNTKPTSNPTTVPTWNGGAKLFDDYEFDVFMYKRGSNPGDH